MLEILPAIQNEHILETGKGLISSFEKAALKQILSSTVSRPGGRVVGRDDYDSMGMIPADTLNPQKARILLMLALTETNDLKEIKRMFAEY